MALDTTTAHIKSLVGKVVSTGMTNTVSVEVTTFKVHPLYHKRYRWTKKYLSGTGELAPQLGDTVKIIASRPLSARKRWMVAEVVAEANQAEKTAIRRSATASGAAKTKTSRKGKKS